MLKHVLTDIFLFRLTMGFGIDLQGRASHDALLHLQDTEIRLLETFKKCMTQRIYADKEYATALGNVVNTATKLDIQQYDSPVFKVRGHYFIQYSVYLDNLFKTLIGLVNTSGINLH